MLHRSLISCFLLCLLSANVNGQQVLRYENVLGTSFELQIDASDRTIAELETIVFAEIDRLSATLSHYSDSSEISELLANSEVGKSARISNSLAEVLSEAERLRVLTGGAFDVRSGELAHMWQRAASESRPPTRADCMAVTKSLASPPFQLTGSQLTKLDHLSWSLDGLAKGYVLDRIAKVLVETASGASGVINIGGDIRSFGNQVVKVDIQDPFRPAENVLAVQNIALRPNSAICTSGSYRRGTTVA
ncbi:MAG TPA: hypothetical protein DDW52_07840, partial [Planctomycetaceae bacterium]|nr:hypothetical protein [Planctomycetaceae bacterium]